MMDLSQAVLHSLSIHIIGNKNNEQALELSDAEVDIEEGISDKLVSVFLSKFKLSEDQYHFQQEVNHRSNSVCEQINEVFEGNISVHEASLFIAKQLYDVTLHPNIKPGELYVVHFSNCRLGHQPLDAIGIFKTEQKSPFFELDNTSERMQISFHEGLDHKCFDKGCLVFNEEKDKGYKVMMFDQHHKSGGGEDARYWKDHFLGLVSVKNEFQQTRQFMTMTKEYISQHLPESFEINKADQIDMLNRSLDYLKNRESFVQEEFEEEVFQEPSMIQTFRKFDQDYRTHHEIDPLADFAISQQAVKKDARVFKSVLKLDKNFHVYIHGNRDMIEQGIDSDGRKYYKIYYQEET